MAVLKDKFDCHRPDYPKITKDTLGAVDNFLETVKVNLRALEKLDELVTSNIVLIKLFTSKVPSVTIRKCNARYRTKDAVIHALGRLPNNTDERR
jgi:hypothetical protein